MPPYFEFVPIYSTAPPAMMNLFGTTLFNQYTFAPASLYPPNSAFPPESTYYPYQPSYTFMPIPPEYTLAPGFTLTPEIPFYDNYITTEPSIFTLEPE
jgi:hypothetical protein